MAATRTASVSGDWDSTVTWGNNPIPVDGDAFKINTGITVIFNVNQTGWTGLTASQINGTGKLQVSTNAGTYCLALNGAVTGTGCLQIGTDTTTPLPSDVKFTLQCGTTGYMGLTGAGSYLIYGKVPSITWTTLYHAEAANATRIHLVDDISTDPEWASGRYLRVDNINLAVQSEETVIQAVGTDGTGGSYIDISPALVASKLESSTVYLAQRNVHLTGNGSAASGNTTYCLVHTSATNSIISGISARNSQYNVYSTSTSTTPINTISDCVFTLVYYGCRGPATYTNCIFGGGGTYKMYTSNYAVVNTSLVTGSNCAASTYRMIFNNCLIRGCGYLVGGTTYNNIIDSCTFLGCTEILTTSSHTLITDSTCTNLSYGEITQAVKSIYNRCTFDTVTALSHNSNDCLAIDSTFNNLTRYASSSTTKYRNCTFTGSTPTFYMTAIYTQPYEQTELFGADNSYICGMIGGTIADSTAQLPTGHLSAYLHTCSSVSYPCFRQESFNINPGERATFTIHWYCSYLDGIRPTIEIIDQLDDPFLVDTASSLATVTMGNTQNQWDTATISYLNSSAIVKTCYLRITVQSASGTLYEVTQKIVPTFVGRSNI